MLQRIAIVAFLVLMFPVAATAMGGPGHTYEPPLVNVVCGSPKWEPIGLTVATFNGHSGYNFAINTKACQAEFEGIVRACTAEDVLTHTVWPDGFDEYIERARINREPAGLVNWRMLAEFRSPHNSGP